MGQSESTLGMRNIEISTAKSGSSSASLGYSPARNELTWTLDKRLLAMMDLNERRTFRDSALFFLTDTGYIEKDCTSIRYLCTS